MSRGTDKIVSLSGRRRQRRTPRRRWWGWSRFRLSKAIVFYALLVILAVGQMLHGRSYPTLVDLMQGASSSASKPLRGAGMIEGSARVIDGDTLDINGTRIRLYGIDAPERKQTCKRTDGQPWQCGAGATAKIRQLVAGGTVGCEVRDRDRYGRSVCICRVGGADIGSEMVRAGLALAYRRYSSRYVGDEAYAERHKAGIWAGTFETPWEWRHRK